MTRARYSGLMPPVSEVPLIATVLPPGEGFGPGRTGAVGLIVRRLARVLPGLVLGGPQSGPVFDDVPFTAVRSARWLLGNVNSRYAAGVARVLRTLSPALIEVHNRTEIALSLARRFPNTPVVLFLHNDPQSMRHARRPDQRRRLLDRLARVVTVSEYLRDRLLGGIEAPTCRAPMVLANPIDMAALPAAGRRDPVITFAGRVVAEKGADVFVAACALALPQLPGWRAELIGADRFRADSPETRYVRDVRAAAARGGVHVLGYRDHPEVLAALSRSAIAVVPSRWAEPFGLAALEAMACGAALICSDRGGLPEVVGDAALRVDPDDAAGMARMIVALARDPDRLAALSAAGRARARGFGVEAAAVRLASLRRQILAAAGGAGGRVGQPAL
ncbi:MAG TPA: glycosyltransferase family 4 protein, partial [Acetobacteraceae bacterium]|nr:glycosyltransferase family 4 protein [Acetobacteraceae bacterium]